MKSLAHGGLSTVVQAYFYLKLLQEEPFCLLDGMLPDSWIIE